MILAIESSCDETSIALMDLHGKLHRHDIYSQSEHRDFQGIVPEIASREHFNKLPVLLENYLPYLSNLNAVAATTEPGLLGPLLVGITAAKTLSYSLQIPFISVHHLHAHMLSPMMEHQLNFPFVNILLSGGHSQIAIVRNYDEFEILSHTVDDACGEAFDKGAVSLDLGYPGGKALDNLAEKGKSVFEFKPSFYQEGGALNMSFSGHKSALRRIIAENDFKKEDLAYSYREALVNEILHKIKRIYQAYPETLNLPWSLSGGVAANKRMREKISSVVPGKTLYAPSFEFCTDNAGMIAYLALFKFKEQKFSSLDIDARPN